MSLTPTDADFDDMHHALGRPDGPWVEPYRNYFCCPVDGDDAKRFAILGSYWLRAGTVNKGADAIYHVTPHGQRQVMAWLELRRRAKGLRPWLVYGGGITARTVVAKSRSAAIFDVFRDLNDVWGIGFREFIRLGVRARLA